MTLLKKAQVSSFPEIINKNSSIPQSVEKPINIGYVFTNIKF